MEDPALISRPLPPVPFGPSKDASLDLRITCTLAPSSDILDFRASLAASRLCFIMGDGVAWEDVGAVTGCLTGEALVDAVFTELADEYTAVGTFEGRGGI